MKRQSITSTSPQAPRVVRAARPGEGYLSEMFCSVQGEGLFVGERQVFLRTAGCTATCWWCDTVYSKVIAPRFVIHDRGKITLPNPLDVDTVIDRVVTFVRDNAPVRTVSITGGEPLEQPEFVLEVARRLREHNLHVYLETNGVHADVMATMLDHVDVVAMDVKLPSAIGESAWDRHAAFLDAMRGSAFDPETAEGASRVLFVKVIVDRTSTLDEIARAAHIVAGFSRRIPLMLQPESGTFLSERAPREEAEALLRLLGEAQRVALGSLDRVRVVPQCHKILRVR